MRIVINRDALLGPLIQAGGVVERRQTLPILANVLIQARDAQLAITATDLEVELKTHTEARVESEAAFTIPARKLLEICKALPPGAQINMDVEGEKAVIRSGRSRFTLGLLPAQDYPGIEPSAAGQGFDIQTRILKNLIEKTQFAMALQDVRYYLNGLLLEAGEGMLRAVATDAHRLALSEVRFTAEEEAAFQVIVPRKAVLELGRLLGDDEAFARVDLSENHVQLVTDGLTFTSKLVDGKYPDYRRVIPARSDNALTVDKETFRQALSRASILSNEKYRGIRVKIAPGIIELLAHNPEQEEAEEQLEVSYDGPELVIGFNVGYLLDVLGAIDEETVEVDLRDSNSSALIRGIGVEDTRYVVMPMRL
jgi:DNA polymerase-3 subunit beta